MTAPLVSVIIATHNAGDYLSEAIASVLGQTETSIEVIVVDDGSTDGSLERVAAFSDKRVKYHRQEKSGQRVAKNNGISFAKGKFIAFCDADDLWYPNKLALQLPLFQLDEDIGVVFSPTDSIDEKGQPLSIVRDPIFRGWVLDRLFMSNFIPFGTAVIRRNCIEELGPFSTKFEMGIDWDLWLRIGTRYKFEHTEVATYAYRIWPGQMSRRLEERYTTALKIMAEFERQHPGKLSASIRRKAYSNTYSNRARARTSARPLHALLDSTHAIALDPLTSYSWKTLAYAMFDRVRSRIKARDA